MQPIIIWSVGLVLLSVATIAATSRTQPAQNVIFSLVIMVLLSALVISLWPTGGIFPRWTIPVLWANAVLNSRAVAKLLLRPWRATEYYGIWLMVVGGVLAMVLLLPLRAPWLGLAFAIGLQVATIPWLIEKRPGVPPPNYAPLWVWVALAGASIIYARWHATQ